MRAFPIAAVLLPLLAGGSAAAADYTSPTAVSAPAGDLVCANDNALGRIQRIFAWTERTLWHRGFEMESIDNPRPSGHPYAEPGLVHRDYCVADSVMTNGSFYRSITRSSTALASSASARDVDFCMPGLDPWHVHDGDCRTVR